MVRRFSIRQYSMLVFAIIILIASWESNKLKAANVDPLIPQESIRIRIIANSDSLEDQEIKWRIRNAVNKQIMNWVKEPQKIDAAREIVQSQLPALDELVRQQLAINGITYGYKVELGTVPFPTKTLGSHEYPEGDYEALRITLGQGGGQNWWCVLFPPLCFVGAVANESNAESNAESNSENVNLNKSDKEVRFFVWDKSKQAYRWVMKKF